MTGAELQTWNRRSAKPTVWGHPRAKIDALIRASRAGKVEVADEPGRKMTFRRSAKPFTVSDMEITVKDGKVFLGYTEMTPLEAERFAKEVADAARKARGVRKVPKFGST